MKLLIIIFLVFLLQSCGSDKSITMPLYQECLQPLKEFIASVEDSTSVEFKTEEFDITSGAHPFVVGFVTVIGSEGKDLEMHKNAVKFLCIPAARISMDRNERGFETMMKDYDSLREGGGAYLDITDDKIRVYYNQDLNKNVSRGRVR